MRHSAWSQPLKVNIGPGNGLMPDGTKPLPEPRFTKIDNEDTGCQYTVKCRYNAVFGVQEIDRVIAVTAL